VIDFEKTIPQGPTTSQIIMQLVGGGTSVAANYVEADEAVSKKEFLKPSFVLRHSPRGPHLIFSKIWRTGKK
jgi:hypothetical protein